MDETLNALFKTRGGEMKMWIDASAQTIQLPDENQQPGESYPVKPLAQLYGKGTGQDNVDLNNSTFLGLLAAIEETFLTAYKSDPSLTDSQVLLALDRLCMSPEADTQHDRLAAQVQFSLRVALSFNDYSRQDVRQCLRKIKQSVARHNKLSGTRGYLTFIWQTLRGG